MLVIGLGGGVLLALGGLCGFVTTTATAKDAGHGVTNGVADSRALVVVEERGGGGEGEREVLFLRRIFRGPPLHLYGTTQKWKHPKPSKPA